MKGPGYSLIGGVWGLMAGLHIDSAVHDGAAGNWLHFAASTVIAVLALMVVALNRWAEGVASANRGD